MRRGADALPALAAVLDAPDAPEALVRRVALVCGRLGAAAGRPVLLGLVRQPHRARRALALRALRTGPPRPAEAPVYGALVLEELHLARTLLHGQAQSPDDEALRRALAYELGQVQARLFGLLLLLYPPAVIADAQRSVAHAARERQANALEMLDNLIPRAWYRGLQILLEPGPAPEKARAFDVLLGAAPAPAEAIRPRIVREGLTTFSDWTLALALRGWRPSPAGSPALLLPHLRSPSALVRASAAQALAAGAVPAHFPAISAPPMNHHAPAGRVSELERVGVLQRTALFAATPENVLSAIVPIMKEVAFGSGETIFAKGDLGASLFIVHAGEVGIFSGAQALATFGAGDFFGELALLDAEPRSATAVAQGPVVAFRLDQDDFYDLMEERGEVLRNILRVLCQRLRRQNESVAPPPPVAVAPPR